MSEWISVEDRLPAYDEKVLIYGSSHYDGLTICIGCVIDRHNRWLEIGCGDVIAIEEVTHWMPLPKAPKGMEDRVKECDECECGSEGIYHHTYSCPCNKKNWSRLLDE